MNIFAFLDKLGPVTDDIKKLVLDVGELPGAQPLLRLIESHCAALQRIEHLEQQVQQLLTPPAPTPAPAPAPPAAASPVPAATPAPDAAAG